MNDPICAVCGESKNINLLMFDYGVCLCHRCTAIAAHAFIKTHTDKRLKELEKAEQDRLAAARLREFGDKSKVAEAAIKFALGTHESLREQCTMCGKAVHPSLITRVQGKYGGLPDRLCPDCLKEYKLKKAEEDTQIHIADLSIENNRLRTKVKDLEKAHSDFSDRCFWFFWIMLGLGVAAGIIFSNIFK